MDLLEERGAVEDEEEEEVEEEGILEADISDTVVDETAEDDELYISSVEDEVEPGGSELDVKLEPMSPPPSPTSICQIGKNLFTNLQTETINSLVSVGEWTHCIILIFFFVRMFLIICTTLNNSSPRFTLRQ